jgi:hypothetical protein
VHPPKADGDAIHLSMPFDASKHPEARQPVAVRSLYRLHEDLRKYEHQLNAEEKVGRMMMMMMIMMMMMMMMMMMRVRMRMRVSEHQRFTNAGEGIRK